MRTLLLVLKLTAILSHPVDPPNFAKINTKFAASVYKEASLGSADNILVSPLSAHIILALSQNGAKGETAAEMQRALHLPSNNQMVNRMVEDALQRLQERDYFLHTVNKIYLKKHFSVRRDFLEVAQNVYRTPVDTIDFTKGKEAAAEMNRWVEEETQNRIHDLVDPQLLDNKTAAVLINALHFRANWTLPFLFFATEKEDFFTEKGIVKVDTMHILEDYFHFYVKPDLGATFLELPIAGGNATMTVVLPDVTTNLVALEERISEVLEPPIATEESMFNVALPRFRVESRVDFKAVLQSLGVKRAFEEKRADFSGIAGDKGEVHIGDVVQKTFIAVNEDGIEAAAATFVVKISNRNSNSPKEFTVNRPFLFFVKVNDLVLFVGRVLAPYY